MLNNQIKTICKDGLWNNNPGLVQLLGLCPLLAISNTAVNALGLGIATTLVLASSGMVVSSIRHIVRPELRIPVFVIIIASLVTIVEYLTKAYFYDLFLILGIFLPLITTNCSVIARAEAFASKNTMAYSFLDGLMMGLGFTAVLVALGSMREFIGQGTLFADAQSLLGAGASWLTIKFFDNYHGFLLAILPPGAFIGLGLLIAGKNLIDNKLKNRVAVEKSIPVASTETAR